MKHYHFDSDILLYNLGDVHRGDEQCDVSLYLDIRDRIYRDDRARWVSTGDLLNVATESSKSSTYDSMSTNKELTMLCEELKPIADKCLGFVKSNHSARINRETGLCLDSVLAGLLNVPYLGAIGELAVTCGRLSHYIAMHHGTGGGTTDGAKANKLKRLRDVRPGMDLYLMGHTHTGMILPDLQVVPDRKRGKMTEIEQLKVTTGHFIDYNGSYAEDMCLEPKQKGAAVVHLRHSNTGNQNQKKYAAWLEN